MLDSGVGQRLGPAPLLPGFLRLPQAANVLRHAGGSQGICILVAQFTANCGDKVEILDVVLLARSVVIHQDIEELAYGLAVCLWPVRDVDFTARQV